MILERIEKFVSRFKQYFVKNNEGFYELSYLANSPESIVKAISRVPFMKHSKTHQIIKANTPFFKTDIYYEELEEGLWVIYAEYKNKTNILLNRIIDEHLLCNYYIFGLEMSMTPAAPTKSTSKEFYYYNNTCHLFKPESTAMHCRFKGTKVFSINIFLHKNWINKTLIPQPYFAHSQLHRFMKSDMPHLTWPIPKHLMEPVYYPLVKNISGKTSVKDKILLKHQTLTLIEWFVTMCEQNKSKDNFFELHDEDKKSILIAERLLTKNLNAPFIGIEALSRHSGMSPSKLKNNFKVVFGDSVFQYYRQKQMEMAFHLIRYEGKSVKEVSSSMGYANGTKFAFAFKKHLGTEPSNI